MTVKRPSRIAVAAVVAPLAFVAACGDDSLEKASAADPTNLPSNTTAPADLDYVVNGVWHQPDGDTVELPGRAYFGAVVWNDQLVVTRTDGEVYAVADVIAPDGTVVDTFETTSRVVVNDAGTTIAWVDVDGDVMTAWDGDRVKLGEVSLSAPGETVAYFGAAITGGPSCYEADGGCTVFVNSGLGEPRTFDSHGVNDNPLPFAVEFSDVSEDGLVTYVHKIEDAGSCGGLVDLTQQDNEPEWKTCEHEPAQIAPDGQHVIGLPSYYDGLGIHEISVLDARDGSATGRFAPEGGFVSQWAWSTGGNVVLDAYDGAQWHLFTMTPRGEISEIGEPVKGEEFDSPFTLIQH